MTAKTLKLDKERPHTQSYSQIGPSSAAEAEPAAHLGGVERILLGEAEVEAVALTLVQRVGRSGDGDGPAAGKTLGILGPRRDGQNVQR